MEYKWKWNNPTSMSFRSPLAYHGRNFSIRRHGLLLIGLTTIMLCLNFASLWKLQHQQSRQAIWLPKPSEVSSKKCPTYGCPVYPAELTPYLQEVLHEVFVNKTKTLSDEFDFGTSDFALLTQKGASHSVNQDRGVLIQPFHMKLGGGQSEKNSLLTAIFDGHGRQGHIVADYFTRDFPGRLFDALNTLDHIDDAGIVWALNKSLVETDIYGPPNLLFGGSTASVTLRHGSKLFIANTGDSQTMIASLPNETTLGRPPTMEDANIVYTTRKDKALLPDEHARITALNGTIRINPKTHDSRVIVYSSAARETIGLAMSRSLGDWEWKPVGVTAEPIVDLIDLAQYPTPFLISASDGFFDMRRNQFYAKQFSQSFGMAKRQPLHQLWEVLGLITPKVQKGYRDDMTAIVVKL